MISIITTSQTPFDLQGISTALLVIEAQQNAHLAQVTIVVNFASHSSPATSQVPMQSFLEPPAYQSIRFGRNGFSRVVSRKV